MYYATEFYISNANAVVHVLSQATETKYIMEQARDIAIEVLRNQSVTTNGTTEGTQAIDSTITTDSANPTCQNEAAAVTTLMGIPINLFTQTANPQGYLNGVTRTLPDEWPLTGERALRRDIDITYDTAGNGDCALVSASIDTLFSYVINTVETAAAGSGNWLTNSGLVRTTKATGNTLLAGGGLCYNVRSASNVLLDLLEDTLGRAGEMYRQAARLLIINDNYINREAYYKTAQQYSGYGGDEAYGSSIRKAFIYDLLTDGNAATLATR